MGDGIDSPWRWQAGRTVDGHTALKYVALLLCGWERAQSTSDCQPVVTRARPRPATTSTTSATLRVIRSVATWVVSLTRAGLWLSQSDGCGAKMTDFKSIQARGYVACGGQVERSEVNKELDRQEQEDQGKLDGEMHHHHSLSGHTIACTTCLTLWLRSMSTVRADVRHTAGAVDVRT